jgi:hypothetical protein
MPMDLRDDLRLQDGPDVPDHVVVDAAGIPYTTGVEREDADLPARFLGPVRPDAADGPPWATLMFGLETGRHDMRERFLAGLRADAAAGRDLTRYGDALDAAYSQLWGGRGPTIETPGFLAFVRAALAADPDPAIRAELERGLHDLPPVARDDRFEAVGATYVGFAAETGHVPADHPSVLYWLSALVPDWTTVHFDQRAPDLDQAFEGDPDGEPIILEAWWAGQRFTAPAENRGDFVDPWSCAGLVNVILRDVARSSTRVVVHCVDEGVVAVGATRAVLRALRAAGVFDLDE